MSSKHPKQLNEEGMVSFLVTLIMIVVISLIVLGFAQVTRRNQRESLDRQLSAQAYYAAESGVNDTVAQLNHTLVQGIDVVPDDVCNGSNDNVTIGNPGSGVAYTCVLVDPTPPELHETLGATSRVLELKAPAGGSLGTIQLSWQPLTSQGNANSCPSSAAVSGSTAFVPATSWNCPNGVLRYDLANGDSASRAGLAMGTGFLVPTVNGASNPSVNANTQGAIQAVSCTRDTTNVCKAQITGLGSGTYFIRLNMIYRQNIALTVSRPTSTAGFADSQIQIDATGKAQDVLRRVRVSLNVNHTSSTAEAGILAGSITKQYCAWGAGTGIAAGQPAGSSSACN